MMVAAPASRSVISVSQSEPARSHESLESQAGASGPPQRGDPSPGSSRHPASARHERTVGETIAR